MRYNMSMFCKTVLLVLLPAVLLVAVGCAKRTEVGIEPAYSPPPGSGRPGPPPHAPAHGYRAKHHYRYYPDSRVYYDTGRGVYFYIMGDDWRVSARLPDRIRLGGKYVSMTLETDKPYLYNGEHQKKYPPGQAKKKNKPGKW